MTESTFWQTHTPGWPGGPGKLAIDNFALLSAGKNLEDRATLQGRDNPALRVPQGFRDSLDLCNGD